MISSLVERIEREVRNIGNSQIIVEGKKDRKIIERLGFKNIFEISGKNFSEILSKIKNEVIILTDFDEEGEELAKNLNEILSSNGIKVNFGERKILKNIFNVKKIEELKFVLKFMEDDYNGKACSIYDKIFNRSRIFLRGNSGKT